MYSVAGFGAARTSQTSQTSTKTTSALRTLLPVAKLYGTSPVPVSLPPQPQEEYPLYVDGGHWVDGVWVDPGTDVGGGGTPGTGPTAKKDVCGPGTCPTVLQKLKDLGAYTGVVPETCSDDDQTTAALGFVGWLMLMEKQGKFDPSTVSTPEQMCAFLDSEWAAKTGKTPGQPGTGTGTGWWAKQSTGMKAGIIVGGIGAVVVIGYFATR